ncbi:MAG: ribonuclease III [Gammaproteobacteria bacterium]|nr:ribonuclease III [Gammaproteobacteria bacterium]NNM20984.1 ribonuclease III [Gammaproteobacteria bacterium]
MAQLLARLDYDFSDTGLARAALTHRSAAGAHNERLEFLGDALLDLVIAEQLYQRCPDASEGDLSRLRASLVRRDTLAFIAGLLELGDYLEMGTGELRSGGFRRSSVLADTLEALLGAIYLDGGYDASRRVVLSLYAERLSSLPDPAQLRDPKTRLQEYLQGRGEARPDYRIASVSGRAHEQKFEVVCEVDALALQASGQGSSRRRAEQRAAQALLELIEAASDG